MRVATVCLALMLMLMNSFSCKEKKGNPNSLADEGSPQKTAQQTNSTEGFEKIQDCDDFLEQYEDWTKEYARFMEKYKDNPGQAYGDQEFIKMLSSATTWTTEWATIVSSCAVNPFYEKRMKEITQNMDDKMKELGFAN